jgi:phospholipase/lecithinase/hemolysin
MRKQILATGFVLFSFLLPLKALAVSFSRMYVFGDSVSDTGNDFKATGGLLPPSPPYFEGRFSNGPIWVDYLAQDLGLNPSPNTNFAFGGATTGSINTTVPGLPGLQQEINGFTQANPSADANGLYIVQAGSNDYLGGGVTDPTVPLANLSNAVTSLVGVGARNILVVNLPDLGKLPSANGNSQRSSSLSLLANAHNAGLVQTLDALRPQLGSDVNLLGLDINTLLSSAIANPAEFNFTNVTDACLSVPSCASADQNQQNQYLFWDPFHPTTVAHKFIGDLAFSVVNSEPSTSVPEPGSALGVLTFAALGVGLKLKRKHKKATLVKSR